MKKKTIKQIKQELSKAKAKDGLNNGLLTNDTFLQFIALFEAMTEKIEDLEDTNKKLLDKIADLERKNKQIQHQVNVNEDQMTRLSARVKLK